MSRPLTEWPREKVIEELKRRSGGARSLRFNKSPEDEALVDSIYAHFGGWDTAIEVAGLHPKTRLLDYWTKEEVVKRLRDMAKRGEPINTLHLERNHPRLWNAARRFFTNIEKAVEAAGFSYGKVRKRCSWSEQEIARRIRKYNARGKDISQSAMLIEDSRLLAAGQKFFGSWSNAVEAAGLNYASVKARRRTLKFAHLAEEGKKAEEKLGFDAAAVRSGSGMGISHTL